MNNSLINNSTYKSNLKNNNHNFFYNLLVLIKNNRNILFILFLILLFIFLFELLLILYLEIKKTTLRQLIYNSCVNKRLKRKKNIIIEMGNLSHSIE